MPLSSLINVPLGVFGLQLTRVPKGQKSKSDERPDGTRKKELLDVLIKAPTNAEAHFNYAVECLELGEVYIANAEVRVARFLGMPAAAVQSLAQRIETALPPKEQLDHNMFYRMHSLTQAIKAQGDRLSVLDVGGGFGQLAAFIPEHPYCLAEPMVNGIAGESLPFADQSFDLVVSCHVLEHIPANERDNFLDVLMSKAKKAVILLNPFYAEGVNERLQFTWDELKAGWAKEHLECVMPHPEDVMNYAARRGLMCTMTRNATTSTAFPLIWLEAIMNRGPHREKWLRFNQFMNTKMMSTVHDSPDSNIFLSVLVRK